jgi:hypothetical protein
MINFVYCEQPNANRLQYNFIINKNMMRSSIKKLYLFFLKLTVMKKILRLSIVLMFLFFTTNCLMAQQLPIETQITGHAIINFSDLAKKELQNPPELLPPHNNELKREQEKGIPTNLPVPPDAKVTFITTPFVTNVPSQQPLVTSPSPIKSFIGLKDNNTVIPPDVMGAAGPNHLMETLNSQYRIFNKSGGVISTLSLTGFWSGLSSVGSPYSDPHLTYDSSTSRWITCIIAQLTNGDYGIFVAASQTSDPTGKWYEYSIDTGPSSTLPDYPLLGYNKKWVVITTNDFKNLFFNHVRITVLNKSKVITGTLGTAKTFFDAGIFTLSPAETLDVTQGTEYLLADYNGNSGGKGYVRISTITGTTGSPVYTAGSLIGVNQPWSERTVDEPQKGSTHLIDAGDTRMGKIILRNGSIWATHTVFLPANNSSRSAAQWWQINPVNNAVLQFGRLDDATGQNRFAFSSIAVTTANDVLIGCSLFGSTIYASAAYAYRNSADAPNILRTFFKFKAGGNSYYKTYGGSRNRWGDYSATCIDYSDGTFWTLQEYATATANTWGTWWANVGTATLVASANANTSSVAVNNWANKKLILNISPNPAKEMMTLKWQSIKTGNALITVVNTQGNTMYAQKIQVIAGSNQQNILLQNLGNGTYIVMLKMDNDIQRAKLIVEK